MKINLCQDVLDALNILNSPPYIGYLCGGAVRDAILGKEAYDFDLTTNAKPEEIINLFNNYPLSTYAKRFGVISVKFNNSKLEITSFRQEGEYLEHRYPKSITFVDTAFLDSQRRDFTINSLYYNGTTLIDFHDALSDISKKQIRTVSDPYYSFNQDALRILRALRFAFELDFTLEDNTLKALNHSLFLLLDIPLRYLEKELVKIVLSPHFEERYNRIMASHIIGFMPIEDGKRLSIPKRIHTLLTSFRLNLLEVTDCPKLYKLLKEKNDEDN